MFRPTPEGMEFGRKFLADSRTVCAFDRDDVVGTSGAFTANLPVPGGDTVPVSGITAVTVAASYRRRGIMTGMMRRLLEKEHELGNPTAGLMATESIIYGRFGYGVAVQEQIASIRTRYAAFRHHVNAHGKVRFADASEVRSVGPEVWQKTMTSRPGMIDRPDYLWEDEFRDKVRGQDRFFVVYEENDETLGYMKYRLERKPELMPSGAKDQHGGWELYIIELVGVTEIAEAALWRFALDVDLTNTVTHWHEPMNSGLLWRLADPRRLSLKPWDALWLRILDPEAALSARSYSASGGFTIELIDDFCPWAGGTFKLDADEEGNAICRRTNARPDVSMPIASLASVYLGAHHLTLLKQAGRIDEHTEGAVAALDAMFATSDIQSLIHEF